MRSAKGFSGLKRLMLAAFGVLAMAVPLRAVASVEMYGDENVLNSGTTYASDPTAGATLQGLALGVSTAATLVTPHGFPFVPEVGDFPGTDQIYVGSHQTASHDGYSGTSQRISGPDNLSLDYSNLLPAVQNIQTFTLGIAFDDFQNQVFGDPFTLSVNGTPNAALSALANSLNQTGPVVQFFTIGLDPSLLSPSGVLNLSIDEGGDGGDGYAIDFLTVGITGTVPEPASVGVLGLLAYAALKRRRRSVAMA
jgi:hypothetical protein